MLAPLALLYWTINLLIVPPTQTFVRWIASKELEIIYVLILSLGRADSILESLQLTKRPGHICFSMQAVLSRQDFHPSQALLQRLIHWCGVVGIQKVTVYSPNTLPWLEKVKSNEKWPGKVAWVNRKDGISTIVSLARDPSQCISSLDQLHTGHLHSSEDRYCGPDLLLSLGSHPGMALGGIPLPLLVNAEIMYGGTSVSVLEFASLLEDFSNSEQRFGK